VAGLSAAGLLLAACGDDDGEPASSPTQATGQSGSTPPVSPTAATSLVTEAVDTTANAQMGGTMKFYMRADIPHFDGATPSAPLNAVYPLVYNSLLGEKPGIRTSTDMEPMAELAESWEWSPDMLRLTLKLRQGVKFHDRPPVSGREMTSEDVVASWNRFAEKSLGRNELVNAANPAAPVLSLTATDPYTVVFDLKEPYAYLLYHLAFTLTGSMGIYPRDWAGPLWSADSPRSGWGN